MRVWQGFLSATPAEWPAPAELKTSPERKRK
jgi:hypothetical protein